MVAPEYPAQPIEAADVKGFVEPQVLAEQLCAIGVREFDGQYFDDVAWEEVDHAEDRKGNYEESRDEGEDAAGEIATHTR